MKIAQLASLPRVLRINLRVPAQETGPELLHNPAPLRLSPGKLVARMTQQLRPARHQLGVIYALDFAVALHGIEWQLRRIGPFAVPVIDIQVVGGLVIQDYILAAGHAIDAVDLQV